MVLCAALLASASGLAAAAQGPLTPKDALRSFQLEPGLRIELVAGEPAVVDPVAMAFDAAGRIYVAENRGYPTGNDAEPAGVVALLEDMDRDGTFEKRTVFAEGLSFPNGVMPWRDGVFVTCAPDLLFLKDTDGDGRADLREVVFTGFNASNTSQLRASHPTLAIDHWIYVSSGLVESTIRSVIQTNRPPLRLRTDFRFQAHSGDFEAADGKAQFGLTFDDAGHRFICMNRVQVQHVVLPSRYLARNPNLAFADTVQNCPADPMPEPLRGHGSAARVFPISDNITTADSHAGSFTAACGVLIFRGAGLPQDFYGNAFSCEPTGNLVHRDLLVPTGATFLARRARDGVEMLASTDNWFRPVFLANGPDGALYICDMYRKTIEHPQYLPEEVRKRTDFESGKNMGRIYRVVDARRPANQERPRIKLAEVTPAELADALRHPNGWWRDTAFRLLFEKRDRRAVPALKETLRDETAPSSARLLSLRLLEAAGGLDLSDLKLALRDSSAGVRENAIQISESKLADPATGRELVPLLLGMASDADPRAQFQLALTLGEIPGTNAVAVLGQIACRHHADRWTRAAILSSVPGREQLLLETMATNPPGGDLAGFSELMGDLSRIIAQGRTLPELSAIARALLIPTGVKDRVWQWAALNGLASARDQRNQSPTAAPPIHRLFPPATLDADLTARLTQLLAAARSVALEPLQPSPARVHAIRFLALMSSPATGNVLPVPNQRQRPSAVGPASVPDESLRNPLFELLTPNHPPEIQRTAINALAEIGHPQTAGRLLESEQWRSFSPPLREMIIAALLSERALTGLLLSAIEQNQIAPNALNAAQRNALLKHRDAALRQRASRILQKLAPEDRMQVYEKFKRALSLKPDPEHGRALFQQYCAACHRLDRIGAPVGPDLFGIRNQPKEAILLHIIVPDYEIVPGYTAYTIETRDGNTITGMITAETDSAVTIRQALGEEETLLRSNIVSLNASGLSLMPQGLEATMSHQEMADLLAFLKGE